MKLRLVLFLSMLSGFSFSQSADRVLYFKKPAVIYQEALPVGNGTLGALIGGNPNYDKISLNEKTLWSGGVQDADNENAYSYLREIQNLLLKGSNKEAQDLLQKNFVAKGQGSGFGQGANVPYGCYQTMGDLLISWKDISTSYTDYSRTLNLEKATAVTRWKRDGVIFTQEVFTSFAHNVLLVRISASKKNKINFTTTLDRKENARVTSRNGLVLMQGQLPNGEQPGMRFAGLLNVVSKGGKQSSADGKIEVRGANECVLLWTAATDYAIEDYTQRGEDPLKKVFAVMKSISGLSFDVMKASSQKRFESYWNTNSFGLRAYSKVIETLSTPERLISFNAGRPDPQLAVLYYNFGRYLLISSSQPGGLPANLQGLWAPEYQTPWNGDYHLNINLQMNYWLAEQAGLGELAEPLHRFIAGLVKPGHRTAKAYYNAPGWVAHVISNPWGYTSPGEGANWGSTLTGGAWLCGHLWEHFRFTRDTAFLKEYYPVIKGAAQFLSSILIEEPENKWLVTAPSNSPENSYEMPDGFKGQIAMGPTMDMQICREVFAYTAEAAKLLNTDHQWAKELRNVFRRLAPNQIGAAGDLNGMAS